MGVIGFAKALGKVLTSREIAPDEVIVAPGVVIKRIVIPLQEKIHDLATDSGICADYVRDLIKESNNTYALKEIAKYLESNRNTIDNWTSHELWREVMLKLAHIAKQDEMIQQWILKHSMYLIESVVHFL